MAIDCCSGNHSLTQLPDDELAFKCTKWLFVIPVIVGLGLLFAACVGGAGLFSSNLPQWIVTIGNTGQWVLFIVGGAAGLAVLGGSACYAILHRSNEYVELTESTPNSTVIDDSDAIEKKEREKEECCNKFVKRALAIEPLMNEFRNLFSQDLCSLQKEETEKLQQTFLDKEKKLKQQYQLLSECYRALKGHEGKNEDWEKASQIYRQVDDLIHKQAETFKNRLNKHHDNFDYKPKLIEYDKLYKEYDAYLDSLISLNQEDTSQMTLAELKAHQNLCSQEQQKVQDRWLQFSNDFSCFSGIRAENIRNSDELWYKTTRLAETHSKYTDLLRQRIEQIESKNIVPTQDSIVFDDFGNSLMQEVGLEKFEKDFKELERLSKEIEPLADRFRTLISQEIDSLSQEDMATLQKTFEEQKTALNKKFESLDGYYFDLFDFESIIQTESWKAIDEIRSSVRNLINNEAPKFQSKLDKRTNRI